MKMVLIFWALYLLVEAFLYLFSIKLGSVTGVWSSSAFAYADLTGKFFGSFFLLFSALAFIAQKNLEKYKNLIKISGWWGLFHGGILLSAGIFEDYSQVFGNFPSLHAWIPFYNQYLVAEGLALFAYSGVVYLWQKTDV